MLNTEQQRLVLRAIKDLATEYVHVDQISEYTGLHRSTIKCMFVRYVGSEWMERRQETKAERAGRAGKPRYYYRMTEKGLRESARLLQ